MSRFFFFLTLFFFLVLFFLLHPPPKKTSFQTTMADREEAVYLAKLAEQVRFVASGEKSSRQRRRRARSREERDQGEDGFKDAKAQS